MLYGLALALPIVRQTRRMLLVEGYMDAIRLHEQGFSETVALCGTSMNSFLVERVVRLGVKDLVLLFDQDEAGLKAGLRAGELSMAENLPTRMLRLSTGKDPDEFFATQTKAGFELELSQAPLFEDFLLSYHSQQTADLDAFSKGLVIQNLTETFEKVTDKAARELLLQKLAKAFAISFESLPIKGQKQPTLPPRPRPTAKSDPPAKKPAQNWPQLCRMLAKNYPKELELLKLLLVFPDAYPVYKEFLLVESFKETNLRNLYQDLIQLDQEGFYDGLERGLEKLWPERQPLVDFLKLAFEETFLRAIYQDSNREIGKRVLRFMEDSYQAMQKLQEEVLNTSGASHQEKKTNHELYKTKMAQLQPLRELVQ